MARGENTRNVLFYTCLRRKYSGGSPTSVGPTSEGLRRDYGGATERLKGHSEMGRARCICLATNGVFPVALDVFPVGCRKVVNCC